MITKDALFQTMYKAVRELLCPSYHQVDALLYPRIVLLRSLNDTITTASWTNDQGQLLWDNRFGFYMFHVADVVEGVQSKVSDINLNMTSGIF